MKDMLILYRSPHVTTKCIYGWASGDSDWCPAYAGQMLQILYPGAAFARTTCICMHQHDLALLLTKADQNHAYQTSANSSTIICYYFYFNILYLYLLLFYYYFPIISFLFLQFLDYYFLLFSIFFLTKTTIISIIFVLLF